MKGHKNSSFDKQNLRICHELQRSVISKGSSTLTLGFNTMLSADLMSQNQTATLSHLQRIADYIELGPNVWYTIHEDNTLEFHDGCSEPQTRPEGPPMTHYRLVLPAY